MILSLVLAAAPGFSGAAIQIHVDTARPSCPDCAVRHPISPLLYGWQVYQEDRLPLPAAQASALRDLKLGLLRWGSGNNSTRYNWKVKGETSPNWYFNNYPTDHDAGIVAIKSLGAEAMFTMPSMKLPGKDAIIVAADSTTAKGGPGKGDNSGPYWTSDFSSKDEQDWLREMNLAHGGSKYVKFWQMDNEAMCWGSTHTDLHNPAHGFASKGTSAAEYWEDFSFLVPKLKAVDPKILVAGDVTPNYYFYLFDGNFQQPDGMEWESWFLKRAKQYEADHGQRILDVLDLHFYPDTYGKPKASALQRLDETRNWWDPSYTSSPECVKHHESTCPTVILPRVRAMIKAHYPGTKLGFSEFAFGDDHSYVGGLCLALSLGWMGKYDVYYATYWSEIANLVDPKGKIQTLYWPMKIFTHYFGAAACQADSSDARKVASFGALDAQGNLTLLLVNASDSPQSAEVALGHFEPSSKKGPLSYLYGQGSPDGIVETKMAPVTKNFSAPIPPYSLICLQIPPAVP